MDHCEKFAVLKDVNDEVRADDAYKDGGKVCSDKKMVKRLRSIGKSILKEVG